MAKQKTIFVTGKIANIIFYDFRGIPCSRSMPLKVRQTKATKASSVKFGKASSIAKNLRWGLPSILPNARDQEMIFRFRTAIFQWLLNTDTAKSKSAVNLPYLDTVEFNDESWLRERIRLPLDIDWKTPGKVILTIPRMDPEHHIAAPAYTQSVRWQITITDCTLDNCMMTGNYSTAIEMEYGNGFIPAQQIELPFVLKPGNITIVAIALKYTATKKGSLQPVEDKRWMPAGVVGSVYGKP